MDDTTMKKLVLWLAGFRLRHAEEWEQNRQEFRQIAENMFHAKDQPEADSYPDHPGRKGGGSLPRGASPADMRKRARENQNVRNGLDGDDTTFIVTGFRKDKRTSHFVKHGEDLHLQDAQQYERAGIQFMEAPLNETSEEITMADGRRCRVDHRLGLVGVVNADATLKTFYRISQTKTTSVEVIERWVENDKSGRNY